MSLVVAAVFGLVLLADPAVARAEPGAPAEDLSAVAEEAGVDVVELAGASNTTELSPRQYLQAVGELGRTADSSTSNDGAKSEALPSLIGAVARADCIIGKESGGLDIPNRQGSGADGPGQYFPGTWASHVGLYRRATGYTGSLSLHNLADVRRVMAYVLTLPGMRAHWTVAGCN